ncbi:MAG: NAD-dependent epimerase/dehydratase family protein [Acidimicrobiales bacterium]
MDALITGGAGFIGSHLAGYLLQQGHSVTVLDDLSTGRYDNIAHLIEHPRFRFELGSILDPDAIEKAFAGAGADAGGAGSASGAGSAGSAGSAGAGAGADAGGAGANGATVAGTTSTTILESTTNTTTSMGTTTDTPAPRPVDTVFHLAAAVGVELVVSHPLEGLMTNVRGTQLVMDAAQRYGCRVLVASSSEIYGKNTSDNISEDDDRVLGSPLKSRWSYSEGKAIEEIYAHTYWREKGLRTVIVRLFNTVGPLQHGRYGMVLPRFVHQAVTSQPLTVYGDGSQSRCFCYVGDVIPTLVDLVGHPDAYGKAFNVGSREEVTIEALAHRVIALAGSESKVRCIPYDEAYAEGFEDMPRRVPDITRVQQLTGFAPRTTLDEIIKILIDLERKNGRTGGRKNGGTGTGAEMPPTALHMTPMATLYMAQENSR